MVIRLPGTVEEIEMCLSSSVYFNQAFIYLLQPTLVMLIHVCVCVRVCVPTMNIVLSVHPMRVSVITID